MTTTVQPTHSPETHEALGSLASLVSGRLTTTADPDYDRARTPWVVNVDQRPAAVLEVADVDDVVAAVRWGAASGVPVAVQPGGHAPRTTLDGTLLLRTRALQGIDVDPVRRTATVGAGVSWGQLCDALDGTGLMALCGSNPDVTVVGLTLGGGVSWFTRKHGFTANSVVSFDVVGADGELRHVTRSSDPDVFWALRERSATSPWSSGWSWPSSTRPRCTAGSCCGPWAPPRTCCERSVTSPSSRRASSRCGRT